MKLILRTEVLTDLELSRVVAAEPQPAVRTLPINQCLITFQCEGTS